jgi:hypothetical protein
MKYKYEILICFPNTTRLKTHRLLQVDIDRREQCCAANYEQLSTMLFQVVTVGQCCNNMLTILFIVGRTTLFAPVDINLQQVVNFLNFCACTVAHKCNVNNKSDINLNFITSNSLLQIAYSNSNSLLQIPYFKFKFLTPNSNSSLQIQIPHSKFKFIIGQR